MVLLTFMLMLSILRSSLLEIPPFLILNLIMGIIKPLNPFMLFNSILSKRTRTISRREWMLLKKSRLEQIIREYQAKGWLLSHLKKLKLIIQSLSLDIKGLRLTQRNGRETSLEKTRFSVKVLFLMILISLCLQLQERRDITGCGQRDLIKERLLG